MLMSGSVAVAMLLRRCPQLLVIMQASSQTPRRRLLFIRVQTSALHLAVSTTLLNLVQVTEEISKNPFTFPTCTDTPWIIGPLPLWSQLATSKPPEKYAVVLPTLLPPLKSHDNPTTRTMRIISVEDVTFLGAQTRNASEGVSPF